VFEFGDTCGGLAGAFSLGGEFPPRLGRSRVDDRPRAPRAVGADEGGDHGGCTGDADRVSTLARADRTPIPNTL
jgi:hypothetical protein